MAYKTKTGFHRAHDRKATGETWEVVDPKTGELIVEPSRTKQEFVDQCDINNIIKSFKVSGMLQHVSAKAATGTYQDLPDDIDFQESVNLVLHAQTAFSSLPSKIRNRFDNDPALFLEFMHDPNNSEEIYTLGLATRPTPTTPDSNLGVAVQETPTSKPSV